MGAMIELLTQCNADLEAEFYSWAVYGKHIPSALRGGGTSYGGRKANLTGNVLVRCAAAATCN